LIAGNKLRTILITSPDEMSDHIDQWEALRRRTGGNAYSSCEISKVWLETFQASASPRLILVEDKGDLVGIAPLATTDFRMKGLTLKTLSLVGGIPKCLRLVTNSIMYEPERRDVLERIIFEMKSLKWSILWTQNMEDTAAIRTYIRAAHSSWNAEDQTPNVNLVLPIKQEGDITETFSKHARRTLGKTLRMMEREGHELSFRKVPPEEMRKAADIYAEQHIERWSTRGGSSFLRPNNSEFLAKASLIAHDGCEGFAYECTIDGEVAGQLFGFLDRGRAYMYRLGMNNSLMRFSPGWLVTYHALNDLRERGTTFTVWGGGEQQYKYEMGCQKSILVGIQATRGAASMMNHIMRSRPVQQLDGRFGLQRKVLSKLSVQRTDMDPSQADCDM
jgi:hypothetical protein